MPNFDHLPSDVLDVVLKKPKDFLIINSCFCVNFERPCKMKSKESPCCLGAVDCPHKCSNDSKDFQKKLREESNNG